MAKFNTGVYPTMITPYHKNEIDYENVKGLVDWYIKKGCTGIFAVCQSSEMAYLSLKERRQLAETVVRQSAQRITIVASGHCGNSLEAQIEEVQTIAETGVDAVILNTNRFDLHNEGDDVWLKNAEALLNAIDDDIMLGFYECPQPYKRLLTPRILDWCLKTGRFKFIKDTCCDLSTLTDRLNQLKGSDLLLFNANGQTVLHTLENGGAGYSGIMANFHPELYVWLCNNYNKNPKEAQKVADLLSMMAWTENPVYPCTAKYYLKTFEGFKDMEIYSRSVPERSLTEYQKNMTEQLYRLSNMQKESLKI